MTAVLVLLWAVAVSLAGWEWVESWWESRTRRERIGS